MSTKEAVRTGLNKVRARFEDRDVQAAFQGFNKSVQFVYPDINVAYVVKLVGGVVTVFREGRVNKPDISITRDSDVFLALQKKEITGAQALGQGKIQVTGIIGDLLLLEKHLL